jgi:hypothetical protein
MLRFSFCAISLACAFVWSGQVRAEETEEAEPGELPAADTTPAEIPNAKSKSEADSSNADGANPEDTQRFDLKYKFSAGDVVRTEVVHRAAVQTTIDGSTQKAETQSRSIKSWRISGVADNGDITFTHMVESIEMWQRMQGREEIRYNSRTDEEVPAGYEEVAKAVGVPLTVVTMDARGKIIKRQEKRAQPMSVSTQMTIPLPDKPIAIGGSWSSPVDIDVVLKDNSNKKIRTRQKFTLEKVVADLATIGVDCQVLTPVNDPAIEAQLIQRMSNGTVRFDIAAGRVLGQQLDLDRHVIGFSGAASSMHYVTRFTEETLKETAETAQKPSTAQKATPQKSAARPRKPIAKEVVPARR